LFIAYNLQYFNILFKIYPIIILYKNHNYLVYSCLFGYMKLYDRFVNSYHIIKRFDPITIFMKKLYVPYVTGFICLVAVLFTQNVFAQAFTFGAIPAQTYGGANFAPGATAPSGTIAYTSSNTAVATIVSGNIHITGAGISTITATNGTSSPLTQTLTVNQAPLTITANNQFSAQGVALPALTVSYSGFVNGDTQAEFTTPPTVSTTATSSSGAGNYPISVSGGSSTDYTFSYVAGNLTMTTLAILEAPITRTYGIAPFYAFGAGTSGISYSSSNTAVATISSTTGLVTITGAGATTITFGASHTKVLTVNKATLTITANNLTKVAGTSNPTLTVIYSGFVNGDTNAEFTTQPSVTTTATTASPAGSYPIRIAGGSSVDYIFTDVAGTLTVTAAQITFAAIPAKVYGTANFSPGATSAVAITYTSSNTAVATIVSGYIHTVGIGTAVITAQTLTVTPAALTITAVNKTKVYGAAVPALTASYSGFVNGDAQAVVKTLPAITTSATAASPAGTYQITANGAAAANYTITYTAGILTVATAPLTITTLNKSKVYGAALPAFTVTYSGFVNGDTQASLTKLPVPGTAATSASPAGSYPITASGAADINYAIAYTDGALTITAATLTITAANQTKIYGSANPTLIATYTGFVNGDTEASLTTLPTVTTAATAASPAGSYPINPSDATDANYNFTFKAGTLTIAKAPLTIAAVNQTKISGDGNPILTATYTGFVNGDTEASLTTPPAITTKATTSSAAGTYQITVSGAVDPNYTITYVAGSLTITAPIAGVPVISYATPQTYAAGTAITPLSPSSTGGTVPSGVYGNTILIAGGTKGSTNATGTLASFNDLMGVATDPQGNIYVADGNNNLIRKITTAGVVTTFAGSGVAGAVNGTGTAASFYQPTGLASDASGNIYVADQNNGLIRKITPAGVVTTLAGGGVGTWGKNADGSQFTGPVDGFNPAAVAVDSHGNVYVADYYTYGVLKITPAGVVSGFSINFGTNFSYAFGIAVNSSGSIIYVADDSNRIFTVTSTGVLSVLAGSGSVGNGNGTGTGATFNNPNNISVDALGNVYVNDSSNNLIRVVSPAGVVTTLAGSGAGGDANGMGTAASLNFPFGSAIDPTGNYLYVANSNSNAVQKIDIRGYSVVPALPQGLLIDSTGTIKGTSVYANNTTNYTVSAHNAYGAGNAPLSIAVTGSTYKLLPPQISYPGAVVYTVGTAIVPLSPVNDGGAVPDSTYDNVNGFAGSGIQGKANGTGTKANFNGPVSVVTDAAGNIYAADENNNVIRKLTPAGVVTTFAGSGVAGSANGTGSGASFNKPDGLAIDAAGNIYVSDSYTNLIRKITPKAVVTTFAGSGAQGALNATGTAASFWAPAGLATDALGNLYVADENNNLIRKITPAGVVSTYAGTGTADSTNGAGNVAGFYKPSGVAADATGNLYVADLGNNLIRKITPLDTVSTYSGGNLYYNLPAGITVDVSGNVYVADQGNHVIKEIIPGGTRGVAFVLAGSGTSGKTNGVGTAASFSSPTSLAFDGLGNLYITDGVSMIRRISLVGYSITGLGDYTAYIPNQQISTFFAGIDFTSSTGDISGTPGNDLYTPMPFTITAFNAAGTSSAVISVGVTPATKTAALVIMPIQSIDGPLVHKALSPNGDGINDVLTIDNIAKYPQNKLMVMNERGAKVYEASGYDNVNHAFDGHSSINGQLQKAGTYFYMLQYTDNGIAKSTTGYIVLKY
jgi:gliding motility-associated-like protein